MKKDFQNWHNKKTLIHESKNRPGFHEREVWWCALGVNVGFEQESTSALNFLLLPPPCGGVGPKPFVR